MKAPRINHIPAAELREASFNPRARQTTFLQDFRRNVENMHRELAMNPAANKAAWEQELRQLAKLCAQEKLENNAAAAANSSGDSPVDKQP